MAKLKGKKWFMASGLVLLSTFWVGTFVLASSTAGGENDPLITKSYLDQYITPSLQSSINAEAEAEMDRLLLTLNEELELLREEVERSISSTAQYEVVTLGLGEQITLDLGTQVVLRIGSGTVYGANNPALVDLTQGTTLNSGTTLTTNHLYLASIDGRIITAGSEVTKIMVYGGYKVVS